MEHARTHLGKTPINIDLLATHLIKDKLVGRGPGINVGNITAVSMGQFKAALNKALGLSEKSSS